MASEIPSTHGKLIRCPMWSRCCQEYTGKLWLVTFWGYNLLQEKENPTKYSIHKVTDYFSHLWKIRFKTFDFTVTCCWHWNQDEVYNMWLSWANILLVCVTFSNILRLVTIRLTNVIVCWHLTNHWHLSITGTSKHCLCF